MTPADAKRASQLCEAISDLPRVKRRLTQKPDKFHDAINLELSAADMLNGEGQGSSAYLYVPPDVGQKIVDAAERIIHEELVKLGVKVT